MRWRAITVLTNTPPRGAQRAPGGLQGIALMEPILAKAAAKQVPPPKPAAQAFRLRVWHSRG